VGKPFPPNIVRFVYPAGRENPEGNEVGTVYANI